MSVRTSGGLSKRLIRGGVLLALVVAAAAFAVRPSDLELLPSGERARIERNFFGLHIHRAENEANWPSVFFGSWRLWDAYVTWARLQPARGEWDFSKLDHHVERAGRAGIDVLMPLGMTPQWASARPDEWSAYGPGQAAEPASLDDWRRYVSTVASRYKGRIQTYELWNEVTEKMFWSGTPERMVELACAAKEVLSAIDPSIRLVAPSGTGIDRRLGWIRTFLDAGGARCVDVLSYHLYLGPNPPEHMVRDLLKLRADLKAAGYDKLPLWNTESGYWFTSTVDRTAQKWSADERRYAIDDATAAAFMPRMMLLERALGFERHYWYAWDNDKMGLIDTQTRSKKPIADVYERLATLLLRSSLDACTREGDRFWRCDLTMADGRPAVAVWVGGAAGASMAFSSPWNAQVTRFDTGRVDSVKQGESLQIDGNVRLFIKN